MAEQDRRSKVVEWDDPAPLAAAMPTMSGLEFLQAITRGDLPQPPIMGPMTCEAVLAEPGRVEFRCEPDESHFNPLGTICALSQLVPDVAARAGVSTATVSRVFTGKTDRVALAALVTD